jgi:hypothetical protein
MKTLLNLKNEFREWLSLVMSALVILSLTGCSDSSDPSSQDENEDDTNPVAMINISDVTENADFLMLCQDGSYIMGDFNADNGYGLFLVDFGVGEQREELTIMVNPEGIPEMLTYKETTFVIRNITDSNFDLATIDSQENIKYYWDIPYDFGDTASRSFESLVWTFSQPFKKWYEQTAGGIRNFTWDEHTKKMIIPYLFKVAAFGVIARSVVKPNKPNPSPYLSLIQAVINEGYKSGLWNVKTASWFDDSINAINDLDIKWENKAWNFKFRIEGVIEQIIDLSGRLNDHGDKLLYEKSHNKPKMDPIFDAEEWQIKVSPTVIEAGPDAATYLVDVSSQAQWKVESHADWCKVSRQGNQVVVEVEAYQGTETRSCEVKITTQTYTPEIPPATFAVVQQGVLFELSESRLSFKPEGSTRGVYVYTNERITSWKVTAWPEWVADIDETENSFYIKVKENTTGEPRSGLLTVTGYIENGTWIDRTIELVQSADQGWNNTSWYFEGNYIVTSEGQSTSSIIKFDLNIQDVATQKFTLNYEGVDLSPTGDIDEMKITLSEDEEGQLILKMSEYNEIREDNDNWDKIDIQQQITIKRISDDAANGIISGRSDFEGKGFGKYYHTILTYDGNITGTRKQ